MKLSAPAREIVALIRRHRLNYDTLRVATFQARRHLDLKPPSRGRHLPQLLTDDHLKRYFTAIERGGNLQHQIMLRLLFYTAVRVAELCHIRVADVSLSENKIFIESGKGDKDRYILFPAAFRLTLEAYLASIPDNEYLFESRHKKAYSTRRIEQLVQDYAADAQIEIRVHPHLFRHQMLTWLTKNGVPDSAIQLISGHGSKQSLERYQHMALKDVQQGYQDAVRKLPVD